jgi:hypothetical protein
MNDYMSLQLLKQQQQQQQFQRQQRMFPPIGRRASLLACMDNEGMIDPVRYIEYCRMKRANFLYHMNNLFPGGGAANLIPSSSTTTPSVMTMMAMGCGSMGGLSTSRNSCLGMGDLPYSMPGASTTSNKMDLSITGVLPPNMNNLLFDLDVSNTSMVSAASSYTSSPLLRPINIVPSMTKVVATDQQQQEQQQQLLKDEYEAAEALLFSMGRACPSDKNDDSNIHSADEESSSAGTNKIKASPSKVSPKRKQRKTKFALPITKKIKITKKSKETEVDKEEDSHESDKKK